MASSSFTFDPDTKRGQVRLLIADTNVGDADRRIFSDAEIDAFLSLESEDVYGAAATACRSIAASASKSAIAWRALERRFDKKQVPNHYRELAQDYERRSVEGAPAEEVASMAYDVDRFGVDNTEHEGDLI